MHGVRKRRGIVTMHALALLPACRRLLAFAALLPGCAAAGRCCSR
jgi:hypothetical protein